MSLSGPTLRNPSVQVILFACLLPDERRTTPAEEDPTVMVWSMRATLDDRHAMIDRAISSDFS
jgi:hypothetical protein